MDIVSTFDLNNLYESIDHACSYATLLFGPPATSSADTPPEPVLYSVPSSDFVSAGGFSTPSVQNSPTKRHIGNGPESHQREFDELLPSSDVVNADPATRSAYLRLFCDEVRNVRESALLLQATSAALIQQAELAGEQQDDEARKLTGGFGGRSDTLRLISTIQADLKVTKSLLRETRITNASLLHRMELKTRAVDELRETLWKEVTLLREQLDIAKEAADEANKTLMELKAKKIDDNNQQQPRHQKEAELQYTSPYHPRIYETLVAAVNEQPDPVDNAELSLAGSSLLVQRKDTRQRLMEQNLPKNVERYIRDLESSHAREIDRLLNQTDTDKRKMRVDYRKKTDDLKREREAERKAAESIAHEQMETIQILKDELEKVLSEKNSTLVDLEAARELLQTLEQKVSEADLRVQEAQERLVDDQKSRQKQMESMIDVEDLLNKRNNTAEWEAGLSMLEAVGGVDAKVLVPQLKELELERKDLEQTLKLSEKEHADMRNQLQQKQDEAKQYKHKMNGFEIQVMEANKKIRTLESDLRSSAAQMESIKNVIQERLKSVSPEYLPPLSPMASDGNNNNNNNGDGAPSSDLHYDAVLESALHALTKAAEGYSPCLNYSFSDGAIAISKRFLSHPLLKDCLALLPTPKLKSDLELLVNDLVTSLTTKAVFEDKETMTDLEECDMNRLFEYATAWESSSGQLPPPGGGGTQRLRRRSSTSSVNNLSPGVGLLSTSMNSEMSSHSSAGNSLALGIGAITRIKRLAKTHKKKKAAVTPATSVSSPPEETIGGHHPLRRVPSRFGSKVNLLLSESMSGSDPSPTKYLMNSTSPSKHRPTSPATGKSMTSSRSFKRTPSRSALKSSSTSATGVTSAATAGKKKERFSKLKLDMPPETPSLGKAPKSPKSTTNKLPVRQTNVAGATTHKPAPPRSPKTKPNESSRPKPNAAAAKLATTKGVTSKKNETAKTRQNSNVLSVALPEASVHADLDNVNSSGDDDGGTQQVEEEEIVAWPYASESIFESMFPPESFDDSVRTTIKGNKEQVGSRVAMVDAASSPVFAPPSSPPDFAISPSTENDTERLEVERLEVSQKETEQTKPRGSILVSTVMPWFDVVPTTTDSNTDKNGNNDGEQNESALHLTTHVIISASISSQETDEAEAEAEEEGILDDENDISWHPATAVLSSTPSDSNNARDPVDVKDQSAGPSRPISRSASSRLYYHQRRTPTPTATLVPVQTAPTTYQEEATQVTSSLTSTTVIPVLPSSQSRGGGGGVNLHLYPPEGTSTTHQTPHGIVSYCVSCTSPSMTPSIPHRRSRRVPTRELCLASERVLMMANKNNAKSTSSSVLPTVATRPPPSAPKSAMFGNVSTVKWRAMMSSEYSQFCTQ